MCRHSLDVSGHPLLRNKAMNKAPWNSVPLLNCVISTEMCTWAPYISTKQVYCACHKFSMGQKWMLFANTINYFILLLFILFCIGKNSFTHNLISFPQASHDSLLFPIFTPAILKFCRTWFWCWRWVPSKIFHTGTFPLRWKPVI